MLMMYGCLLISDQISCSLNHLLVLYIVDEVQSVMLELDVRKGVGFNGILFLILKNCASAFACPLSLLFNRFLLTRVFPGSWKLSYVIPTFKRGRRNNIED
jgi:hypothetical protein